MVLFNIPEHMNETVIKSDIRCQLYKKVDVVITFPDT